MQAAKAKIEEIKRQKEIEKVPKNSSNRLRVTLCSNTTIIISERKSKKKSGCTKKNYGCKSKKTKKSANERPIRT
jgi:hypothetical protein